mmetsp:Transcript_7532/g.10627  ORF Transcript_7532/g.10627 Transcript_7532/m.10627 type:complete len:106 (+) Transcript_7532:465-782(+)
MSFVEEMGCMSNIHLLVIKLGDAVVGDDVGDVVSDDVVEVVGDDVVEVVGDDVGDVVGDDVGNMVGDDVTTAGRGLGADVWASASHPSHVQAVHESVTSFPLLKR